MASLLRRGIHRAQRLVGMGERFLGEIKDDSFYRCIQRLAGTPGLKSILEIGSSAGGGSTEAFVTGIRKNSDQPSLYCLEVAPDKFAELRNRYPDPFVRCYNASSVPLSGFATEQEVREFVRVLPPSVNRTDIEVILGWRRSEIEFLGRHAVPDDGIARIKRENGIDAFDLVLIDGSEFTGRAEFEEVLGAKYMLLDDIHMLKNHHNCQRMVVDPRYRLIESDVRLRNGFAAFERI